VPGQRDDRVVGISIGVLFFVPRPAPGVRVVGGRDGGRPIVLLYPVPEIRPQRDDDRDDRFAAGLAPVI
jgi:hypothetical protein